MEYLVASLIIAIILLIERTIRLVRPQRRWPRFTQRVVAAAHVLLYGFIVLSTTLSPLLAPGHALLRLLCCRRNNSCLALIQ